MRSELKSVIVVCWVNAVSFVDDNIIFQWIAYTWFLRYMWNTTGSLIGEKFLALCALRCHSILLFVSIMCVLGGRIRSMGMI